MARSKDADDAGRAFLPHLTALTDGRTALPLKGNDLGALKVISAQNILKVHDRTSPELRALGRQWYPEAQRFADRIGKGDVVKGAGVIAALSPNKQWDMNQRIAEKSMLTGRAQGTYGNQTAKAQRIMDGEHPLDVLGPLKERSFYHSIINPLGDNPAIDRHAHDIAMGTFYGENERGLSTPSRYQHFQDAYQMAAGHLGMPASELQAVTWTGWRGKA